jgi:hypothetical protein
VLYDAQVVVDERQRKRMLPLVTGTSRRIARAIEDSPVPEI